MSALPAPPLPVGVCAESVYEDPRNEGYVSILDTAPKWLVDELCRRYPVLRKRLDYLRLTVHLLLATAVNGGLIAAPLPYEFLGALVGKSKQAASRNFESGAFLGDYARTMAAACATHPERFVVSFSRWFEGQCRRVKSLVVPEDLRRAVLDFRAHPIGHDLVLVTLKGVKKWDQRAAKRYRDEHIDALEPHPNSPPSPGTSRTTSTPFPPIRSRRRRRWRLSKTRSATPSGRTPGHRRSSRTSTAS